MAVAGAIASPSWYLAASLNANSRLADWGLLRSSEHPVSTQVCAGDLICFIHRQVFYCQGWVIAYPLLALLAASAAPMTFSPPASAQLDPLNSPYPIPWNWILAVLAEKPSATPQFCYYRSPSLISPDGAYAAYSRIQFQRAESFVLSRVASILFVEHLSSGRLHTITPAAPFADNPFVADAMVDQPGTIAISIPVGWSENGDQLLVREFESLFGSSLASDFAVIWDRSSNRAYTVAPTQVCYSNAVLLGWSQRYPSQALFRAGNLGDDPWLLYAVDRHGHTTQATNDRPLVFGKVDSHAWVGPQS